MKKYVSIMIAIMLLVVLAACGNNASDSSGNDSAGQKKQQAQAGAFPLSITDKTGTEVKLEKKPERIVSVMPSATEIAYAVGAGDKVVGVSNYDNYPEEVKTKEKVGDLKVNIEKVVSLEPDLILADTGNGEAIEALRKTGLPVVVMGAKTFDEIYDSIEMIGKVTGNEVKAAEVIKRMKDDVREVQEKVKNIPVDKRPNVWIEVDPSLFTAGKGTFMHDMVTMAGGNNIAADLDGWKQLSEEKVLQRNPDVILNTYGYYNKDASVKIKQRPKWQQVKAVRNGQVYSLDSDVVNRPAPRITQGLKEIAQYLHPELFHK
ncbi:ABC transporter substrate-binding protein [Aneurinibacillus thermoaerophilus]|uniref:ABC transporter substrate-binding protein n=1 Tax=Aneurinibacillus thermoaerophilus TaxID=143495 RepID=UPI002E1FB214|nr:ABC transporter substrate-binding protein [Aneurinibacillus thermoaerophilus]MED0765874.1 ABC transporter substrate-binding protein [Aneurinibacillus thermoaerophilus]